METIARPAEFRLHRAAHQSGAHVGPRSVHDDAVDGLIDAQSPRVVLIKSKSLSSLARRILSAQQLTHHDDGPWIVPAVGVAEYRRTTPLWVRPDDVVLEVGCHFGRTARLLHEASRLAIGVAIGPKIIRNAQKQHLEIPFHVGDAWKTLDLLKLRMLHDKTSDGDIQTNLGYDVVYADIGELSGARGVLESLSLLDALCNALRPRSIDIKSLRMRRLSSQLKSFDHIWAKLNSSSSKTAATMTTIAKTPKSDKVEQNTMQRMLASISLYLYCFRLSVRWSVSISM